MSKELVMLKESKRYPGLFTRKYRNLVFFKNLWNEELLECRGHVQLADGTLVVNPFTKIFNKGENGTDINPLEICLYVEKVNGFMAAATYVKQVDKVVVSTTGSLDSEYVDMAEEYITNDIKHVIKTQFRSRTFLFEICHPNDPHIIYEKPGAYLIGSRKVSDTNHYFATYSSERTLDFIANNMFLVKRPRYGLLAFREILERANIARHEGFIVYGQTSNTVLKLKTPYYLSCKAIARIKDLAKLDKRRIPEEFYPLVDYIRELPGHVIYNEQERLGIIRRYYGQ